MLIDSTVAITTWDAALVALGDIEDPPPEALSWASANWDERRRALSAASAGSLPGAAIRIGLARPSISPICAGRRARPASIRSSAG